MSAVTARVRALLESGPPPDEQAGVRHALAVALASKLDEAVEADTAASGVAVPQLSKELRAVLEEIAGSEEKKDELMDSIFAVDQTTGG